ncbi:MAG: type I secretion C-terminal target domain-containing protein, partial [Pseudomonadota bacterium]
GNSLNNVITGTAFNDVLNGASGSDTMIGGLGDDTYYVDNVLDVASENVGAGTDTVFSSVNYTLGANTERLNLTGAALIGTGNALDNIITGTSGHNILNGGLGADTMVGGLGDDTYYVESLTDVVTENVGEGSDTVNTTIDGYILGNNIENLVLSGAAHYGVGNAQANTITGTNGADILDGGAGVDTLVGGLGDDTYYVDNAADVLQEALSAGTDTAMAAVNYTLGDNIENLTLTGAATIGTGNALDNILMGGAAADTLYGLSGNDTIDGGVGADTMVGGIGDDTYYVDNIGDIIIEAAGEGIDKVIVGFDYVLGENIESAHITGAAHSVTGNSGNNTISGGTGDDHIDGGAGDDLEIGGGGNDILISSSGLDSLAGGEGDDVYVVKGGHVEIEDFIGHDTLDASEAIGDSYIDLSGDDISHIQGEDTHMGAGGTTLAPLDVQFLQDLSGSFGDDIANVRTLVPNIVTALQSVQSNSMFGSSTFVDKPTSPFGSAGDWVYQTVLGLTNNAASLASTYNAMVIHSGADEPEAQIEALMQLALRPLEVGFRADSARFVVLFTDAPFHVAGNGALGGITNPNNGDVIVDATEDYPLIAQVKAALEVANIIPIFAIAGGYESTYQGLVTQIGRGTVVTLSADSSNVVAAISAGMTAATVTQIEDAKGGEGNDTLKGNDVANVLTGNNGNDIFIGRGGDDIINGGAGVDTAVFSGVYVDYLIKISGVTITITDNNLLDGNDGKEILTGVEVLQFLNATINLTTSTFEGSTGIDTFTALNNNNWTLNGLAANDSLKGRNGNDIINGNDGNDTLNGKAGDDDLTGGLGNDRIYGGDGNDIIHYANNKISEGYDRIYGEVGFDRIVAGANNTYIGIQEITGVEEISANGFSGVAIRGNSSDQNFDFSATTLINIANIDMGAGNDRVMGSSGADSIKGNLGNDILNGCGGADILYGGGGADIFNFDSLSLTARDTVRDFSLTDGDVINLQNLLAGYDPVTSAIADFVRISDSGLNSYVAVDVDGALNG